MGSASSTVKTDDSKHVVVVGGGYGGTFLATKLIKKKACKITVIDPKDAMFHSIGALRLAVEEGFAKNVFIPYKEMLGESFHQGTVVSIDTKAKSVTLGDGETISYTHLVIATGTRSPFPSKLGEVDPTVTTTENAIQLYSNFRKELLAAKSVVLVGGGAVGVELAGEIITDFPDKKVSIITSTDYLVAKGGKPSFQKNLMKLVKHKKIEVLLKERVANLSEITMNKHVPGQLVKTESGKELECDMVIPCTGTKINSECYKNELADAMSEAGVLHVDEYLQVKGHNDVFAIGDVNDVAEEKMAFTAKLQAALVVANLTTTNDKKKQYKPAHFGMIVPVGRDAGVGEFSGMSLGNFLVKNFKGKDLFTEKIWSDLEMKVPA